MGEALNGDAIAVRHLWKRFGAGTDPLVALQDIDFSVRDGEFVSIVGPSGCGKSTLLKILAGLLPASEGDALLRGTSIDGPRRDIGVVFQSPVLFPWRSVFGNVLLPATCSGSGASPCGSARSSSWTSSVSRASSTATRGSCRAACSSGSRSCAPLSTIPLSS